MKITRGIYEAERQVKRRTKLGGFCVKMERSDHTKKRAILGVQRYHRIARWISHLIPKGRLKEARKMISNYRKYREITQDILSINAEIFREGGQN